MSNATRQPMQQAAAAREARKPSFGQQLANTQIPEAPVERNYQGPPRIWWFNGQQSKHPNVPDAPGEFYIPGKDLTGFVPGEPWVQRERFKGEIGYTAEEMAFIFICRKRQPFRNRKDQNGKIIGREYQARWTEGTSESYHTEWLVIPQGFFREDGEPVLAVWSMKGMVGKRSNDILSLFQEGLLRDAAKITAQAKGEAVTLPTWTFWMPVGPEIDQKGRYVFTDTGFGSVVQLPQLRLADSVGEEEMEALYVGPELLTKCREIYDEHEEWRGTLHGLTEDEAPAQAADQNGNGGNDEEREFNAMRSPAAPGQRVGPGVPRFAAGMGRHRGEVADDVDPDDIPF